MSTKSRTNWRQRAVKAEARCVELEKAAKEWKELASVWRNQTHALQDEIALGEVAANLAVPTAEEPEGEADVSE